MNTLRRMAFVLVTLALLAACSSGPAASTPTVAPNQPTMDATAMGAMSPTIAPTQAPTLAPTSASMMSGMSMHTQYPVTITDCDGRQTTYDKAPERVVTIDPSMTEMLLVLGLKDKIVGYTEFFAPDQQWAATKTDLHALHMINDGANYPSKEAVVAVKPDLVASVYSYAFSDPLPDRDGWRSLGIHTYQALGSCSTGGLPADLSVLYHDMRNLGVIFDVQDRAETEIAKIQRRVAELQKKVQDAGVATLRLAPYDGFDKQPTYYGGMENAVVALAGAKYIWANADPNVSPSWEQFVAADPQVIWIVPDAGVSVDELKHRLESNPRLSSITGIKNKAYIVVPQADATIESPRLVDGLEQLVNNLIALKGTASRTTYPVTITDCGGRTTTYDKAPERVVTLDPSITEALLLLGLKDKIVGLTQFQTDDQMWATTKADMESLSVINDGTNYPSKEAIVAASPDLVMSTYPSALLENHDLPDRDGWAKLGVKSYLTQGECHLSKTPVTDLSALYADLHNFGIIFDVQDRAVNEIAKLQARVATLQQNAKAANIKPLTVWSYSGEADPYPAGSVGTPNAIITLAGARNAFGDITSDYDAISWEEIVKRNPEVIWVMTSAGSGFIDELQGIEDKLNADPRLANVTAVKNKAYVVVSYNDGGIESPRNVDALEQMINGLAALN